MAEDYTLKLITDIIRNLYSQWKANGLSDDEIILRTTDTKLESAFEELTDKISEYSIDWLMCNMHEWVKDNRARTNGFMTRNEQLWNKGFIASEAMYLIVLESTQAYSDIVSESSPEILDGRAYLYLVLSRIQARACQQFLEILHLLKGGFADGAFARWRSLYELSVVAKFIKENGESVAKAYYNDALSFDCSKNYWAKAAPCFKSCKGKSIQFAAIQEQCGFSDATYKNPYDLANQVVHSSPQGTFGRLCVPSVKDVIPVGRSDYGLAAPAINAAISLAVVSEAFFVSVPSGDGIAYIKTINKWSEIVRECYEEIEEKCFDIKSNHIGTKTDDA